MRDHMKTLLFIACASLALVAVQSTSAEGKHDHKHKHETKKDSHAQGGGHDHGNGHWAAPQDAAKKTNPIKNDDASIERGAKSYNMLCVSCHGIKAMGDGPVAASLNPKPTNLKAMSGGHADGDFAWKIANGKGAMPPWKEILDENQIWDLVNFIQNLKNIDQHDVPPEGHSHDDNSGSHTH